MYNNTTYAAFLFDCTIVSIMLNFFRGQLENSLGFLLVVNYLNFTRWMRLSILIKS